MEQQQEGAAPPAKKEMTPEQVAQFRAAKIRQMVAERVGRLAGFASAALTGIATNPVSWCEVGRCVGISLPYLASTAWELAEAMDEQGQRVFQDLLQRTMAQVHQQERKGGDNGLATQAGGDPGAGAVGAGPGGSSLILPS